jgi:ABC-type lipoprotein release transport system permease subunit
MMFNFIFQSIFQNRKRYFLIFCAIASAFLLSLSLNVLADSALAAIRTKAARYFSGHASVSGYVRGNPTIGQPDEVVALLEGSGLPVGTLARRTTYNRTDAAIFFNGETVRQRKLLGIDFSAEGPEFSGLAFDEGGWEPLASDAGERGILISVAAAKLLGCRVGDGITLYLSTDTGQHNTAELIVRGIFNETSLFGYVAYMRRIDLNRLIGRDDEAVTDIAAYAAVGADAERFAEDVRLALAERFNVFPCLASREARDAEIVKGEYTEETLAVLSLNAQLAQIKELLDALRLVIYFVLAFFLLLVMVGILNTYRVMVHERVREIGTLRALGMSRIGVRILFLAEAGFLALASSAVGLAASGLLLALFSALDLSFVPAAGLFLENGHLRAHIHPRAAAVIGALMLGAALAASWGPAAKAARVPPAQAMRTV